MSAPVDVRSTDDTGDPGAPMVELTGVTKWFRGVVAVSDVSFRLGPGVTALLGPNGAGKSTVLRLLCGLARPSRGTVRLFGHDPRRTPEVLGAIGIVPQQDGVLPRTSAFGFVRLAAVLAGADDPAAVAGRCLEFVELDPGDPRPMDELSRGNRQRAKIAQALVGGPAIVVADEPLNGLDPRQRRRLTQVFAQLGEEGRCVVISSHVLDEVERFGSQVLVLAQGRLAAEGDFHAIRDLMDDRPHRIRVRSDRPRQLAAELLSGGAVVGARVVGEDQLEVQTSDVGSLGRTVAPVARRLDASLEEVLPLDDDLESVFRYIIGPRGGGS
ncbi:MAG TPA: ABC transporter ATP-binding protein [Microthrixaceae bacterium]|nr:ABC transporter ATP-binding protein [Microthrixaceae bacterium]